MDSKELPGCMPEHVLQVAPRAPTSMADGLLGRHAAAPGEEGKASEGCCLPRLLGDFHLSWLRGFAFLVGTSRGLLGALLVSGGHSGGGGRTAPSVETPVLGAQTCIKLGSALMTTS